MMMTTKKTTGPDGRAPNGRAPEGSIARLVDFNGGSGVRGFASWLKEVGFELISSKSKKKGGKRVRQRENACGYVAAWVASKMVRSDWTAKRAGYSDAVKKSVVVDGNEYLRVHKDHRHRKRKLYPTHKSGNWLITGATRARELCTRCTFIKRKNIYCASSAEKIRPHTVHGC